LAEYVREVSAWRVTMTPPMLNAARAVLFLASGPGKAGALRLALEGSLPPALLPVKAVRPASGCLDWMVDLAAASGLARVTSVSTET
jgi:6-phosphogluconolactonase